MAMDKEACRALLPNVGDEIIRTPSINDYTGWAFPKPQKCRVVYVNREHLWYRVQFLDGTYDCYKVPDIGPRSGKGVRFK